MIVQSGNIVEGRVTFFVKLKDFLPLRVAFEAPFYQLGKNRTEEQ